MNTEENKKKILVLSNKYKEIDIKSLKSKYSEYIQYLKDNCELNLRLILEKYYNGIELNELDKDRIEKYILFSNKYLSSHHNKLSEFELSSHLMYGSGNFDEQEIIIIEYIYNTTKQNIKIKKK